MTERDRIPLLVVHHREGGVEVDRVIWRCALYTGHRCCVFGSYVVNQELSRDVSLARVVSILLFYSEGPGFDFRTGGGLSWLIIFLVFAISSRPVPSTYRVSVGCDYIRLTLRVLGS